MTRTIDGASYVCSGGCFALVDAGTDGIDCSRVGCSPPPTCDVGCTAPCGCCPCAEGETIGEDGGMLVCSGGCWAPASG
jgi:hypothetical protein